MISVRTHRIPLIGRPIMASSSIPFEKSRGTRIGARVSATQKALIQLAAALSGRSLSEFVLSSAQEAATKVIEKQKTIKLIRTEQAAFVRSVLNPPAPTQRLRRSAKAYKQLIEG